MANSNLQDALDNEAVEELHDRLHEHHKFHVINPPHVDAVGFSLWAERDDYEFPILTNTGGLTLFNSIKRGSGEGSVQPSDEFFNMIAYTYHQHVCVDLPIPTNNIEDTWDDVADAFDYKQRDHERWAGITIVSELVATPNDGMVQSEIEPIRNYVDCCTEWGVPPVEGKD